MSDLNRAIEEELIPKGGRMLITFALNAAWGYDSDGLHIVGPPMLMGVTNCSNACAPTQGADGFAAIPVFCIIFRR